MVAKRLASINTPLLVSHSLTTTIGRALRTTTTRITHGTRTSVMATRTTTTATTTTTFAHGVSAGSVQSNLHLFDHGQLYFDFMHDGLFSVEDIFNAYFSCRANKRNTKGAIEFEEDYERNLLVLLDEINERRYIISPSIAFIVDKPVIREIFAASFRDRIVHHLLIGRINSIIEKRLIYDCYACRVGKGTHLGIKRLRHFILSATDNYQKEAFVLKLDIRSFFMNINKSILWNKLESFLVDSYREKDLSLILYLAKMIVFHDPTESCIFRCSKEKWKALPAQKSLFHAKEDCGLPIGNLTSQVFANFYMSFLDHYIKHALGIRWYGRYVDDFFIIHHDKAFLKDAKRKIEAFLKEELLLEINDKKVYLQSVYKGVRFLGADIKIGHTNMSKRVIANFASAVDGINKSSEDHKLSKKELKHSLSVLNSYLGICSHYDTYALRRALLSRLDYRVARRLIASDGAFKVKMSCI